MNLAGKTVLITGGRRVGGSLALDLARRGANVALTYHTSRETIERTVAAVEAVGVKGLALEADLARASQAAGAVEKAVEHFGRLDALVNMASIYTKTPFADLLPTDFDAMIAANLAAPYFTAVAAGKAMLAQSSVDGIKGKIVNMGDWSIDRPGRDYLPYIVAKGGLKTFTLALAKELAPHVLVTMVQPGTIELPEGSTEADKRAVEAATLLGRVGVPDDANRMILYLLEGTDYATGACYRVDGGRFLGADSQGL